ncbi:4'-phosphopantetheinyl transferase family protein [Cohnella cholangitidis]|nr:4'-phosphopantetheinyl transferase superfamily protein [Cohnella cholangitidis]
MKVYLIRIDHQYHASLIKRLSIFVSKTRMDKAIRFKMLNDFNRSIAGELLVNYILMTHYGILERDLEWGYRHSGKPYLISHPHLYFNLSHAEDYVTCIFDSSEIGIDIEYMRDFEYSSIANRYFTRNENAFVSEQGDENKLTAFYRIWTQKESYLKATGSGLSTPLDSFEIQFPEATGTKVQTSDRTWFLHSMQPEPDYMLSVCHSIPIDELSAIRLSLEEIAAFFST